MILDCDEIMPGRLWVGGYVRAEDAGHLKQMGFTVLFSLQSDRDLADYNISEEKLLKACALAEIAFYRRPTADFDTRALMDNLPKAVEDLEKALGPQEAKAYVHCTAGINRAPTLAAAYLIRTRGWTAREAFDFVAARRQCNPYLTVLEEYETYLKTADPA